MMKKYELSEIDNRDSNTTELVMDNGDRLNIDFQESIDIMFSFIENQYDPDEPVPEEMKTQLKKVLSEVEEYILEYGIDIS